jgi:hypothetical protein
MRELDMAFQQIYRVLKDEGTAVIVFDQSPSRPVSPTVFIESLKAMGFSILLERERSIPVGRRQMPSVVREKVVVARK